MSALKKANTAIAIVLSIVVMGPVASWGVGLRPTSKEFSSQWIDIIMGGMMAPPGESLALVLNLKNKSSKPLQVSVAFVTPDPAKRCKVTKQLNSGQSAMFSCPQTSVTPNTDYPIEISIYSDKERKDLLEKPTTKFHFSEKEAKAFAELATKLGSEKAPTKDRTSLANQARVIGERAAVFVGNQFNVRLARDDGSPNPVFDDSLTIPAGKNRILIGVTGKYDGNQTPKNFQHVNLDAKAGHEYFVSIKYKMFTASKNMPLTMTDKTTGQIVYTTANPSD